MRFSTVAVASTGLSVACGAVLGKRALSGEATYYGGNVAGGSCSFSTYTLPSNIYGTALSDSNWANSGECGACVSVTGPSGNNITAMVRLRSLLFERSFNTDYPSNRSSMSAQVAVPTTSICSQTPLPNWPMPALVLSMLPGTMSFAPSLPHLNSTIRKEFLPTGSACKLSTPTKRYPPWKSARTEEAHGYQPPVRPTTSLRSQVALAPRQSMSRSPPQMETF